MLLCERIPATWIKFGSVATVTPLWMFTFGLMLLGSPSAAICAAIVGTIGHGIGRKQGFSANLNRIGSTATSLATAGLVLIAMDVHGAITQFDPLPWRWGLAIVLTGFSIIVANVITAAIDLSLRRRISFVGLLRRGVGARVSAEGALLSLAPLWVIGVDFSVVLVPLLGITTLLVFSSTRQSLERAHEANHDALTGLLNRRSFLEHVDDALLNPRTSTQATILVMDLNGFKEINDELGHQIGDCLLVAFGERLEHRISTDAVVCRLGGDEFAVLLMEQAVDGVVDRVVARLHNHLVQPLAVEGFPVSVGVSIGVATAPADGRTTSDLLRAADVAMYRAKRTNQATARYENCAPTQQRGRLNLLGDLDNALKHHQLHLNFQPQVRVADGTVDTVEALIRWTHPEHGPVPPNEFIGLAEQTDLIGPLTDRVLRLATQMLASHHGGTYRLAVNVSARSLQDRQFADNVLGVLAESGFSPRRLELEVTERALVSNVERTIYTIDKLRRHGIRIAIDDFGVGYSSFQTLRLLDVDRVKIDRDFIKELITQPRDRLIVASVIQLAHDLGLDVVAEGVENQRVWQELTRMRCDLVQGYGIAVPMAYPELRDWIAQHEKRQTAPHLVAVQR